MLIIIPHKQTIEFESNKFLLRTPNPFVINLYRSVYCSVVMVRDNRFATGVLSVEGDRSRSLGW